MRTVSFAAAILWTAACLLCGHPALAAPAPSAGGTNAPALAPLSFFARITAVDTVANSLTVSMPNETTLVVLLQADTKLKVNGPRVAAASFKPGETVLVRGRRDTEGRILAIYANNQVALKSPTMAPKKEAPAPGEKGKP